MLNACAGGQAGVPNLAANPAAFGSRTVRGLSILFCLPPLHPCSGCLTSLISEEWLLVQLSTI